MNAVLKKEMADLNSSMQFHSDTIDKKRIEVNTKVSCLLMMKVLKF